jgi:orotidine-5'-phosphate decarboxylase
LSTFAERLRQSSERNRSLLCVGLDPDLARMPVRDVFEFNRAIIDATQDLVCAYKPNVGFYESLGEEGQRALRRTLDHIPGHIPVIGDCKRGDVQPTAASYARAMFDVWGFDAVTVNPYGGGDTVQPFTDYPDRGVFVWCRSSNPGAGDLQDLVAADPVSGDARPLYEWVAMRAAVWNASGNVGLVVGATYPQQLRRVRELCPGMPILVPGIGAQRGAFEESVAFGVDESGANAVFNVSRGVLYASSDPGEYDSAARREALAVRDRINAQLANRK